MTDLELAEQKLEEALENLEQIESFIDDAAVAFREAFNSGYKKLEKYMDVGFQLLRKAKDLI